MRVNKKPMQWWKERGSGLTVHPNSFVLLGRERRDRGKDKGQEMMKPSTDSGNGGNLLSNRTKKTTYASRTRVALSNNQRAKVTTDRRILRIT